MLADVARKKVLYEWGTACKIFQWLDSRSLIQLQLFADMDTITKEAQNTANLDGTKKSNKKFREHELWGRVEWMLSIFTQKKYLLENWRWWERSVTPGPRDVGTTRCWSQVFPQGLWFLAVLARCLLLVALLCWVPEGSWGLDLLSRVWQWRGWFLLLPWGQTHGGFREILLGMGNQPCGCGFRVASQNKPPQDTKQNQPRDPEQN